MVTNSSTLAWKIPWMEEPGRLQSMGSWRVGHNWATSLSLFTFMHWRRKLAAAAADSIQRADLMIHTHTLLTIMTVSLVNIHCLTWIETIFVVMTAFKTYCPISLQVYHTVSSCCASPPQNLHNQKFVLPNFFHPFSTPPTPTLSNHPSVLSHTKERNHVIYNKTCES